ncbi:unnamed protein product [Tetraodon nigroviridis]|uniref:(spotted green pufferfish) hypothetical protein n=1 Tax=Tetraodon nigroviridis TaxID=99883 RepID=Q4S8G7_TETNG|nr:unnamed protein product [Tetraodon nigroviridis]
MEIYNQTGEYCGTARGERVNFVLPDISDRGPFYEKQLILDQPSSACEVKVSTSPNTKLVIQLWAV